MEDDYILLAFDATEPSYLTYDEWLKMGMGAKEAGLPCSVWDDWSKRDPKRYHPGECAKKWETFNKEGTRVSGGTVIQIAKEHGFAPERSVRHDDGASAWDPVHDLKTYLEAVFDPEDIVGYTTDDVWKKDDGKWAPGKGVYDRKAGDLIADLKKHPDDITATIGKWNPEAGAWIRINPLDGNGVSDKNVTKYRYVLVESDNMMVQKQEKLYRGLELPIVALVHSGGKSIHAIVHIDADSYQEYEKRVVFLFDYLKEHGVTVDEANKNPSRLSRMPGITRGEGKQRLIATNIGKQSWDEWESQINGSDKNLPIEQESGPVFDCDSMGKIYQTDDNVVMALESDPELSGSIKYNELAHSPYLCGTVPWDHESKFREWRNIDDAYLYAHLEGKYGLTNRLKIADGVSIVADKNKFNPVTNRLSNIYRKEWDHQTGYIENLLPDYMGVEKNVYSIECMRLIMLGAINRAFNPGCKFDYMPVLVGKQGIGKSTFFKYLAIDPNWYNDNFNTIEGDKAFEKIRGYWFVEMAELLATKRAKDVEAIKSFLTSTTDTYRQPYDRRAEHRERMCVFVGTTNNEQFLTDRTGNRRFLPLMAREDHIKKSLFDDPEAVQQDFINAWGEAMDIYLHDPDAKKLILSEEASAYAQEAQQAFTEDDPRIGLIQEWLNENKNVTRVCACMLYREALGFAGMSPSRHESNEILSIMANDIDGWERVPGKKYCVGYGTTICYERVVTKKNIVTNDSDSFMQVPDEKDIPFG